MNGDDGCLFPIIPGTSYQWGEIARAQSGIRAPCCRVAIVLGGKTKMRAERSDVSGMTRSAAGS